MWFRLGGHKLSLFLLRCVQPGLSIRGLALLTVGMMNDMYAENRNDEHKYAVVATQENFDKFWEYFLDQCIKYSQLYSQCVIVLMLGIKVGKRIKDYEHRKISFGFMCI